MAAPEDPDLTHWVSKDDWEDRKHWFREGDLVEFNRKGSWFNHWGMYMGKGLLVHVTRYEVRTLSSGLLAASATASQSLPSLADSAAAGAAINACNLLVMCGDRILGPSPPEVGRRPEDQGKFFVRTDDILFVAGDDEFRVNNAANSTVKYAQRAWPEIFQLVCSFQNGTYDYSVLRRNCEHFVTFLRYQYGTTTPGAGQRGN
ncbi:hypothetical protein BV898_04440 [Hypsibius exemplaris]|uniref:LRAT domain-containing protein n=1 Tax=Hypsibius exemplaris TaxID=2072580 RepID=A0A1W0X247_HYPEX|nr:hypothetical protein BV898_04440 [Hypsibius exemplaris]